jgi:hypothetical protein
MWLGSSHRFEVNYTGRSRIKGKKFGQNAVWIAFTYVADTRTLIFIKQFSSYSIVCLNIILLELQLDSHSKYIIPDYISKCIHLLWQQLKERFIKPLLNYKLVAQYFGSYRWSYSSESNHCQKNSMLSSITIILMAMIINMHLHFRNTSTYLFFRKNRLLDLYVIRNCFR